MDAEVAGEELGHSVGLASAEGSSLAPSTTQKSSPFSLTDFGSLFAAEAARELTQLSFTEYLNRVAEDPRITWRTDTRLWHAIQKYGSTETVGLDPQVQLRHFNVLNDPFFNGSKSLFGVDGPYTQVAGHIEDAARGGDQRQRMLLLYGLPGSGKSTMCTLTCRAFEVFHGEVPAYETGISESEVNAEGVAGRQGKIFWFSYEPLWATPAFARPALLARLNDTMDKTRGISKLELASEEQLPIEARRLIEAKGRNWYKHLVARPMASSSLVHEFSAAKARDLISAKASLEDTFIKANRGIWIFPEFLHDPETRSFVPILRSAAAENAVGGNSIDAVIIALVNETGTLALTKKELEGFGDRFCKVDVPLVLRVKDEMMIYERDRGQGSFEAMPHSREVAARWAVLTRLEEGGDDFKHITPLSKMKLYDGEVLPDHDKDIVTKLRHASPLEGLRGGRAPRFVQDIVASVRMLHGDYITPVLVLEEIGRALQREFQLVNLKEQRPLWDSICAAKKLLDEVRKDYHSIIHDEIFAALSEIDLKALIELFRNYIKNVSAYTQGLSVKNPHTGQMEEPSESVMRGVEERIDIPESRKDDFRKEIMNLAGALGHEGRTFEYNSHEPLSRALKLKLQNDQINVIESSLRALRDRRGGMIDDFERTARIREAELQLVERFGYTERSALDVLSYYACHVHEFSSENEKSERRR